MATSKTGLPSPELTDTKAGEISSNEEWLSANEALKCLVQAYEDFTAQPIVQHLRSAQADLQAIIAASNDGRHATRLDRLRSVHSVACAVKATAAMEMFEELILTALSEGALPSRPTRGYFRFAPRVGSGIEVGLYGRMRTVPVRFWEMLRQAEDRKIDWAESDFTFGQPVVHASYGSANSVEFRRVEFQAVVAQLGELVGTNGQTPPEVEEQEAKSAKQGRPKGAGGWAAKDALIVEKMRKMMLAEPGISSFGAASYFAGEAAGNAEFETKQRRLATRYRETYPE